MEQEIVDGSTQVIDKEEIKLKKPRKYHILFHNDDYTPFEFVETLLMKVFHRTSEQSRAIAKEVHKNGTGIAGTYTRDVAETKYYQALNLIKETEYPLQLSLEPES